MTPPGNNTNRWYPRVTGKVPYEAEIGFRIAFDNLYQLRESVNAIEAAPPPLTLEQVQSAIQVGGTHPINVQGLLGTPSGAVGNTESAQ